MNGFALIADFGSDVEFPNTTSIRIVNGDSHFLEQICLPQPLGEFKHGICAVGFFRTLGKPGDRDRFAVIEGD